MPCLYCTVCSRLAVIAFAHQRKEHTDAIADMAVSHFIEMRDRVADAKFLLKVSS